MIGHAYLFSPLNMSVMSVLLYNGEFNSKSGCVE